MKTIRVAFGGFLLAAAVAGVCALVSVVGAACSSPEKEGATGAQCAVFTDCTGGLFCVNSFCTADAAALVNIEEAGAAPKAEAAAAPQDDGSVAPAPDGSGGGGAPPSDDAGVAPDTSSAPTADASGPAAMPPGDAAGTPEAAAPAAADDASDEP